MVKSRVYKTSSATFLYRYVLTSLFGGIFISVLFFCWSAKEQFSIEELKGVSLTTFWALIWLTILLVRLRSVEANQENLIVKVFNGHHIIDYKNIEWIFQTVLIRPVLISMKYRDVETGKSRKILLIPNSQNLNFGFFKEVEMTKFIRERLIFSNPDYLNVIEPSRWRPIALMLLIGLSAVFLLNIL